MNPLQRDLEAMPSQELFIKKIALYPAEKKIPFSASG